MESWQEDRIWIWLIAASKKHPDDQWMYFMDLETKALLLEKHKNSKLLESDRNYEYPPMDDSFPLLEDPNAPIFSDKQEDIEKMNDSYRRMKYAEKVLADIGLAFEELKVV